MLSNDRDADLRAFVCSVYRNDDRQSIRKVAELAGVGATTVLRILEAAGIERRHRIMAKPVKMLTTVDAAQLRKLKAKVGPRNVSRWVREAIAREVGE